METTGTATGLDVGRVELCVQAAFKKGLDLAIEMLTRTPMITPMMVALVVDGRQLKELWRMDVTAAVQVGAHHEIGRMAGELTQPGGCNLSAFNVPPHHWKCDYVLFFAEAMVEFHDRPQQVKSGRSLILNVAHRGGTVMQLLNMESQTVNNHTETTLTMAIPYGIPTEQVTPRAGELLH